MKNSNLFKTSRVFYVVYDNVVGLETGAPVTINGMRVGQIKNLSLKNKAGDAVIVTFDIESDFEFSRSSQSLQTTTHPTKWLLHGTSQTI